MLEDPERFDGLVAAFAQNVHQVKPDLKPLRKTGTDS
jgi:hypothetical protein